MKSILTFIGMHDRDPFKNPGPIISLLAGMSTDRIFLFYNNEAKFLPAATQIFKYCKMNYPKLDVVYVDCPAIDPTDYNLVYPSMYAEVEKIQVENPLDDFTVCITGGTPTMHACWVFLVQGQVVKAEIVQVANNGAINPVNFELDDFPEIRKVRDVKAQLTRLARENKKLKETIEFNKSTFIGESPAIVKIKQHIQRIAPKDLSVLINGESGTGKEEVAKSLHQFSGRYNKPMVVVNCGAIPKELFESELFGHKKGAFTGADKDKDGLLVSGDGGTVFLDEIGDLPLEHQVKLLRAIENKSFSPVGSSSEIHIDVRFVFATNKNLPEMIALKVFREDLYYRIAKFKIICPPLRDRGNDKLLLAEKFLKMENVVGHTEKIFSSETKREIIDYNWPGNVRELRTAIEVAYALSEHIIEPADLNLDKDHCSSIQISIPEDGVDLDNVIIPRYYQAAMMKTDNNASKAAELLGLKPHTFRARLKKSNNINSIK